MHGRDSHGIHAAAASVAKIPYRDAADGISHGIARSGLGRLRKTSQSTGMLDAFFSATGFHGETCSTATCSWTPGSPQERSLPPDDPVGRATRERRAAGCAGNGWTRNDQPRSTAPRP
jgi:hypothetical protein